MARELETLNVPPLGALLAFRGVHALTEITPEGKLRATHYAYCLIGGREPMWGVWSVNGTFQRFFGSREQIMYDRQYKNLLWRRKNATWNMVNIETKDREADERRKELRGIFHKGATLAQEPVAALSEDGNIMPWQHRTKIKGPYRPLYAGAVEPNNVVPLKKVETA